MNKLSEKAILIRLSFGLPGESRQDPSLSAAVKTEHSLGASAGNWIKRLYPPDALRPTKQLDTQAYQYHLSVTLPFDLGIRILPAALLVEHGDQMRDYAAKREKLAQEFTAKRDEWVEWGRKEHNGTFDITNYPSETDLAGKFYMKCEPLPVPDASHFEEGIRGLLGTDAAGVDLRIADAALEAQRDLLRRMIEPVRAIAAKLSEEPKEGRDTVIFRDTLVDNIKAIAKLAPALNLNGDAAIDAFTLEMKKLTAFPAEDLRRSSTVKEQVKSGAQALLAKMEGYNNLTLGGGKL